MITVEMWIRVLCAVERYESSRLCVMLPSVASYTHTIQYSSCCNNAPTRSCVQYCDACVTVHDSRLDKQIKLSSYPPPSLLAATLPHYTLTIQAASWELQKTLKKRFLDQNKKKNSEYRSFQEIQREIEFLCSFSFVRGGLWSEGGGGCDLLIFLRIIH